MNAAMQGLCSGRAPFLRETSAVPTRHAHQHCSRLFGQDVQRSAGLLLWQNRPPLTPAQIQQLDLDTLFRYHVLMLLTSKSKTWTDCIRLHWESKPPQRHTQPAGDATPDVAHEGFANLPGDADLDLQGFWRREQTSGSTGRWKLVRNADHGCHALLLYFMRHGAVAEQYRLKLTNNGWHENKEGAPELKAETAAATKGAEHVRCILLHAIARTPGQLKMT